ncbi:unnamed protein product [Oikopleura dioica]|uniref:CUE domain-containing protein n=1 Tax=Oikopleura dioica TaxID=34765 RepID=E4XFZ1_OIKDI|nr:unnamed protein product [Oikopleura dioica]
MVIENVLEYGKAMAQFSEMFPKISPEGIDKILRRNDGDVESTMEMLLAISSDEDRFLPLFEVNDDAAKDESKQGKPFHRSPRPPSYREALQCPSMSSERLRPAVKKNVPPSIPSPSLRYLRARNSGETNSFGRHANHREISQIEEDAHIARQLQKNEIFQRKPRNLAAARSPSPTHVYLSSFQGAPLSLNDPNDEEFGGVGISSSSDYEGPTSDFGFLPGDENSNSTRGWVASAASKPRQKGKQSFTNGLASVTNWCRSKFKKIDNGTARDYRPKIGSTNRSFSLSENNETLLEAPHSNK